MPSGAAKRRRKKDREDEQNKEQDKEATRQAPVPKAEPKLSSRAASHEASNKSNDRPSAAAATQGTANGSNATFLITCILVAVISAALAVGVTLQVAGNQGATTPTPPQPQIPAGPGQSDLRDKYPALFKALPSQFDPAYSGDCWRDTAGRLRCLPSAYVIGMPQCGLPELSEQLSRHPLVVSKHQSTQELKEMEAKSAAPEPWASLRSYSTLDNYADRFRPLADALQDPLKAGSIAIDVIPHAGWWRGKPVPELLHAVQPNAKLILVLCDPALRAFKDYNTQPPVTAFDQEVSGFSVKQLKTCIELQGAESCLAVSPKGGSGRVGLGLYSAVISRWTKLFRMDQLLLVRAEDLTSDQPQAVRNEELRKVLEFLGLPAPSDGPDSYLTNLRSGSPNFAELFGNKQVSKASEQATAKLLDRMSSESETILRELYQPYNAQLAQMMGGDPRWLWLDTNINRASVGKAAGAIDPEQFMSESQKKRRQEMKDLREKLKTADAAQALPGSSNERFSKNLDKRLDISGMLKDAGLTTPEIAKDIQKAANQASAAP